MATSSLAYSAASGARSDEGVGTHLESARGAIEGRFLDVGEVLSQVVEGTNALISALDRTCEGLVGGQVSAATAQLGDASDGVRTLPESLRARHARIAALMRAGDDLTRCIEEMRQHLAYLRVFGVNIKITSGGIAAAGPEFAIFAQEICDCIELGRTQLDTFRGDLSQLGEALTSALKHEDEIRRRCDDLVPAVPDALVAKAAQVTAHQARIGQIGAEVGELARQVRKKVGAMLAALQIGDITRQRIEHVQHGLALLTASGEIAALPGEARARAQGFVRRLLAAQLAATTEDFYREVGKIGVNVGAIARDAHEIMRLRDHAQGQDSNGEGSFLRGLETSIGQAFTLVEDINTGERLAQEVSQSAARSAQELAAQIEAIQNMRADVQMMALNTTLKCARIGEAGKPLGVIAIELRAHAGHLETSAARTLEQLKALSASADAQSVTTTDEQGGAASAASALRDAVDRIHQTSDAVEVDLTSAAQAGASVVDMLKRAVNRFDFQRQVGAHLDQAAAELSHGAATQDEPLDDVTPALRPLLNDLARCYTMAQEREVHAALTAGLDLTGGPEIVEEAPVADEDVFF